MHEAPETAVFLCLMERSLSMNIYIYICVCVCVCVCLCIHTVYCTCILKDWGQVEKGATEMR